MRVYLRWILEKELERRETARERARATSREKGAPYLVFGVDSRARLQQQCYRFRMSAEGGSEKRSGPVLLHRRSGASHAAVRKAHVHTCIHWMRACMCVCEPIHVHLHAHITRYVHTVYTCVGIHTHTCAYTHTQTCTQDTNPKLWDARVQKAKKKNHVTIVYTYVKIHKYSQYKKI
jgi:hypothetical protein